jgi:valyl-tRNA synthetase
MATYKLIWDDFCSWYLEMIKPAYQQPVDAKTLQQTVGFFEKLMKILHPFMPFLTEEIWHLLADRDENDCIMIARLPERHRINHKVLEQFNFAKDVIIAVRGLRNEKNIPMKEQLQFFVKKNHSQQADTTFDGLASKLCNLAAIEYVEEKVANAMSFVVGSTEFYIPLTGVVDLETELKKLEDDLAYTNNFLNSVVKKLENERFVSGAPEAVVDLERKKQADAENKIKVLEEQIANLKNLTKS